MSFNSQNYWENRYVNGGNSGPGSYGRLAEYKAEFINRFVKENSVHSVIEYGCGDGNQLELAEYPLYFGFDVSQKSIELCLERFGNDSSKSFIFYDSQLYNDNAGFIKGDLTMSLDVIYHLIEDHKFEKHIKELFTSSSKYVIIYSSNTTKKIPAEHVKHRKFTDYIKKNFKDWKLLLTEKNRFPYDESDPVNTSHSDFFVYQRVN